MLSKKGTKDPNCAYKIQSLVAIFQTRKTMNYILSLSTEQWEAREPSHPDSNSQTPYHSSLDYQCPQTGIWLPCHDTWSKFHLIFPFLILWCVLAKDGTMVGCINLSDGILWIWCKILRVWRRRLRKHSLQVAVKEHQPSFSPFQLPTLWFEYVWGGGQESWRETGRVDCLKSIYQEPQLMPWLQWISPDL